MPPASFNRRPAVPATPYIRRTVMYKSNYIIISLLDSLINVNAKIDNLLEIVRNFNFCTYKFQALGF
jgi:hypothetical protein